MVSFKDFDESKLPDYTVEELRTLLNEIEMKRSVLADQCASEMAVYLKDESFDLYSARGSRKIKKIAKKYTPALEGGKEYYRIIAEELRKKENYEEEQRYSGRGLVKPKKYESTEEFLQKEQDKTWAYRSKIE